MAYYLYISSFLVVGNLSLFRVPECKSFYSECLNVSITSTKHSTDVVLILVHRLRRWSNIKSTLFQRLVLVGTDIMSHSVKRVSYVIRINLFLEMSTIFVMSAAIIINFMAVSNDSPALEQVSYEALCSLIANHESFSPVFQLTVNPFLAQGMNIILITLILPLSHEQ